MSTNGGTAAVARSAVIVLLSTTMAYGFELETHRAISAAAFEQSVLRQGYLETQLSLDTSQKLRWKSLRFSPDEWFEEGSVREDDSLRFVNHFYDPTRDRGLRTLFCGGGARAFDWALAQESQAEDARFSWTDARRFYIETLTATRSSDREAALARVFRTLGDVVHLIQDMASPEHTRNDPHAGRSILGWSPCGVASLYETGIEDRRKVFNYSGYLTPPLDQFAQFWTTSDGRGLADFSNRNFVTKSTNFTAAVDGNHAKDYPLPRLVLDQQSSIEIEVQPKPGGAPIRGTLVFFGNYVDDRLLPNDVFYNDRMTTYSLFDRDLKSKGKDEVFTINRFNVDAAATLLLPRAAGYSAGLLDYFFRGRLDGDVVVDPADPSSVRFEGRNVSQEALEAGTLQLYGEDASGTRTKLTAAAGAGLTVSAAPGQAITSATFQASPNAEKFVAVYTGTLGHEVPSGDPASPGSFPGAVIGKVLGGVRVEEIFNDGTQWKVRTPTDVFLLKDADGPLTVARYEQVKWGDTDNLMVARSPMNDPAGARLVVYQVPRRDRSVDVLPVAGTSDVLVTRVSTAPFPFDLVVATVDFAHTVEYRQRLARADYTTTNTWTPTPPPDDAGYYTGAISFSPFTFEAVDAQSVPFAERFPVVLDHDHLVTRTYTNPYFWRLSDIAVDATGRPLAMVIVFLGDPEVPAQTVPVFRLNSQTGVAEVSGRGAITAHFPAQVAPLLWALIDVAQGRVVASTADPTIVIRSSEVREAGGFWVHSTADFAGGGPKAGQHEDYGWFETRGIDLYGKTLGSVTPAVRPAVGEGPLALTGWLRDELLQAAVARGVYTLQPTVVSRPTLFVYYCDENNVCSAMQIDQPVSTLTHYPGQLWSAVRTRPTAAGERLAMLAASFVDDPINGWGDLGDVLVWEPGVARARFLGPQLGLGFQELFSAASGGALVLSSPMYATGEDTTWLFKLDGTDPIAFPGVDLWGSYIVLEPSYLYSVDDLKFHRATASLDLTPLPASLVTVTGNPTGDYHAIRLP